MNKNDIIIIAEINNYLLSKNMSTFKKRLQEVKYYFLYHYSYLIANMKIIQINKLLNPLNITLLSHHTQKSLVKKATSNQLLKVIITGITYHNQLIAK